MEEVTAKEEIRCKWVVGILILVIAVISSFSSLLTPFARQVWPIVFLCGFIPFLLEWRRGRALYLILSQLPTNIALVALIATAISQVIAANELPSGLLPLHSLPGLGIIYGLIGSAIAFVFTWFSLKNDKWASGGAALTGAAFYSSVIFFRVAAVQEVGLSYVVMIGFLIIYGLTQKNGIGKLHRVEISYWKWILFFTAVLLLAALASPVPGQSFTYVLNLLILICLTGCVAWYVYTYLEFKKAAWIILLFGAGFPVGLSLIKVVDIATMFDGLMFFSYRLHPTEMGGANILARSVLISAPLGAALYLVEESQGWIRKIRKWGLVLLEVLILAVLLYSRSFEGFFAWLMAMGLFLILFLWERIKAFLAKFLSKPFFRISTILLLSLIAGILFIASVRIATTLNILSFNGRFAHWVGAIVAIRDNPLLGGGPDNEYLYTRYSEKATIISGSQSILDDPLYVIRIRSGLYKLHGHNILLEVAAFSGLAGAIGLMGIWFALMKIGVTTWRGENNQQRLLVAACMAGIVGELSWGILDVTRETPPFFSFPVWAMIGLLLALSRFSLSEQKDFIELPPIIRIFKFWRVVLGSAIFVALLSSLANNQYASGFLAFQERRWQDAVNNLQLAVFIDPFSAHYRWMLSKAELEIGQVEEAKRYLDQAIVLKKGYSPYLTQAGWLAWLQDDLSKAELYFTEAIANDPLEGWTPGLHANLGLLMAYQDQDQYAIQLFAKSLEYRPELASSPYWIIRQVPDGSLQITLDTAYDQSAERSNTGIRLLSQLGVSEITPLNFSLPSEDTETVLLSSVFDVLHEKYDLEVAQMNTDAHLILAAEAEAARVGGLYDRAVDYYQEYQHLSPDSSFGYRDLALVYIEHSQLEQARVLLEQAIKVSPNDLESLKLLGNLYLQQNNIIMASRIMNSIKTFAAEDAFHLRVFDVDILELERNLGIANGDADMVYHTSNWIAAIRGTPDAYLALANAEQNTPDKSIDNCWQAYEKLVQTWAHPYDSNFWEVATCIAGSTLSNQQIYQYSTSIDPYYRSLLQGHIFRLRNQFDLAEKSYNEAVYFRDGDGAVHFFLGELYEATNDIGNTEKEYNLAGELDPFASIPLIALGNLYAANSDYSSALDTFQKVVTRSPSWEVAYYVIANLYYQLGEYREAAKYYNFAIQAGQSISTNTIYNFIANITEAKLSTNLPQNEIKGDIFKINGEQKPVLYMHPESLAIYTLALPETKSDEKIRLNFWIGMSPASWNQAGDGVDFTVNLVYEGISDEIFNVYIDPKNFANDRCWLSASIDLTSFAGKEISLEFRTSSGPSGDNSFDWAGWGNPSILVTPP